MIIAFEKVKEGIFCVAYVSKDAVVKKATFENISGAEDMMMSDLCVQVSNIDVFIHVCNNTNVEEAKRFN